MLRRGASRLLPRLLVAGSQAAGALQQGEAALLPRLAAAAQADAVAALRSFKSSAAACSSSLAESLRNELDYEKQNYEQPEELAAGPPAGFTLTESKGDTLMSLSKDFRGETLTVDIMVNDQPEEELVEDESGALDADVGAIFTVTVSKGSKSLVFECKSDGQYFAVQHVSLEPANGDVEDSAYTGPVYEELDEELQKHFEDYLAERGVDAELGAYLLPLIHDKEQREYMQWLEEVERFVQ